MSSPNNRLDVAFNAGTLGLQLKRLCSRDPLTSGTSLLPTFAYVHDVVPGSQGDKGGVKIGDSVVAVSGVDFSRTPLSLSILDDVENNSSSSSGDASDFVHVPTAQEPEEVDSKTYEDLMTAIKSHDRNESPLVLTFQRFHWCEDAVAWSRFLKARDYDLASSKAMLTQQQEWRSTNIPVDRQDSGIVRVLRSGGVGSVLHPAASTTSPSKNAQTPFLYVNLATVQSLNAEMVAEGNENGADLIVSAFVSLTEECLDSSASPLAPKVSQLIDLGAIGMNFSPVILKKVYYTFEANYPETLSHFVIYPVNRFIAAGINGVLGFINEKTKSKFVITDDLNVVCETLGIPRDQVSGDLASYILDNAEEE